MRIYVIIDYSWARSIVGNARTEIKERIRRETRYDGGGGGGGEKKRNPRASTYTCISGKTCIASRAQSTDWLHGEMGIFHVRGCIIEISALGRIKSGRPDQWLTRIVGAVRKIPYLHTKIRACPLARWAGVLHFFSPHFFSPLSDQSARAW